MHRFACRAPADRTVADSQRIRIHPAPQYFSQEGLDPIWLYPFTLTPVVATALYDRRMGWLSLRSPPCSSEFSPVTISPYPSSRSSYAGVPFYGPRTHDPLPFPVPLSLIISIVAFAGVPCALFLLRNRLEWSVFYPTFIGGCINIILCTAIGSARSSTLRKRFPASRPT